jgi:hypothetical protein
MGSYYGVRSLSGELIAMGGERLKLDGFTEISGVYTHPTFRGRRLAAAIIWKLVRDHRRGRCDVFSACCQRQSTGSRALFSNGI